MLPKKTSLAVVTFGGVMLLLQFTRLARSYEPTAVLDFHPRPSAIAAAIEPPPRPRPAMLKLVHIEPNLIDGHDALKHFYQALWRTESKEPGAVTRILHYGDSPTTADSITADVRSLMQERFGDAGHGFVLVAKPWAWYGHHGVDVSAKGWFIQPASQSRVADGVHGLGGVSFQGSTGASSRLVLKEDHARMEVHYLSQPGSGLLVVRAEGNVIGEIETAGPEKTSAFQTVALPPGARHIELTVERGFARVFGVSFERDEPGVIYNSLGLNGGQVQVVVRYFDKAQWAVELQHETPDLVIVNYGTNESLYADYIERYYAGELRDVIRRIKAAVPKTSVLMMSPMDRGQRDSSGQIATPPALPRLVEIQKQVAAQTGCAFFNTFQAMGGEGTMARWYESQSGLVSADFMHPLPAGARRVGVLFYQALESGFEQFKTRRQEGFAREP